MNQASGVFGGLAGALGLCCILLASSSSNALGDALKLYVAIDGKDSWSGRLREPAGNDGPFATLERARDEIRKLKKAGALPRGGVVVEVGPGRYELERPFELSKEDSGTEEAPVVYRGRRGCVVWVSGGRLIGGFKPVTEPQVVSRLDEKARGRVVQVDLKARGITEYGSPAGGGLEVFFRDRPMTLARWPNEGFVRIAGVLGIKPRDVRGTKGDAVGKFIYEGDRPERWVGEKDLWAHGYWFWDCSDQRQPVESIDTEKRIISLKRPYHHYGYRKGQWYYIYNALSELDSPGEWYLDRERGILYFWPPDTIRDGDVMVTLLPDLIKLQDVSYVTLRGFVMDGARNTAVRFAGGTHCRLIGCTIRNIGGQAVRLDGGTYHAVIGCDIYNVARGGISMIGGERKSLTPAHHVAENNNIHDYGRWWRMYQAGIGLHGVGLRASHNLIHNAPHQAIAFSGNDHLIEFNEIHSVCYESNDAGAIYAGRDWTWRGTLIRHNYFHDITGFRGRGCVGVYLDDMLCGTTIYGNLLVRVTRAAFIGGGRDNVIENNIFVDCRPAVHLDSRAMGWAAGSVPTTMTKRLLAMPYKSELWVRRYPKLVNILEDEPAAPKGNIIVRNICWGGRWDEIDSRARRYVTMKDNLIGEDPHFVDIEGGNYQLRDDSPAYELGFKPIPMEKMGLYRDPRRASWPVRHAVRPVSKPEAVRRSGPPPEHRVPRRTATVEVDGELKPAEWLGLDRDKGIVIEQGIRGEKVGPATVAWIVRDGDALYVAFDNAVDPARGISAGDRWGRDDAVEIALRNPAAGRRAPIIVLRGYATGHYESSTEAGAPESVAGRVEEAVRYAARIVSATRWTCEWRIPFASLGVDPSKHKMLQCNLSVRKTSPKPLWLMWQGTGGYTWLVDQAGVLRL